jgi:hypothetical protein
VEIKNRECLPEEIQEINNNIHIGEKKTLAVAKKYL